jgi:hypothetical protein
MNKGYRGQVTGDRLQGTGYRGQNSIEFGDEEKQLLIINC